VLGADHPLARAARARSTATSQFAATSALLVAAVANAFVGGADAVALLSWALIAELCLAGALAFTSSRLRERARDVIADADEPAAVAEVAAERTRLASPRTREQLARGLERALHAAEHWHELSITSRPPPTVRDLLQCRDPAREVTRLVRERRTAVRGVALLDRLLCGGYTSALYAGSPDGLARELGRIRFLLEAAPSGE
jgi:hypothetical protein